MKITRKIDIQEEMALNHSSNIDFKIFMNLDKKCTAKPYFFSDCCYSYIR